LAYSGLEMTYDREKQRPRTGAAEPVSENETRPIEKLATRPQVIIFVLDARVEIMTRGFHEVASSKILVILNLKSCLFSVCYRQRHIHRLLVQLLLVSPSNKNTLE
jgi:hypothetical protein